ncbi:TPA: CAMP factor family pore-forming toxin, partial [Streptococcus pyogenes]
NKAITHAVGVQLNPTTTVQQVDDEVIAVQNALETALKS